MGSVEYAIINETKQLCFIFQNYIHIWFGDIFLNFTHRICVHEYSQSLIDTACSDILIYSLLVHELLSLNFNIACN